jgi:GntR family transcriptional repressor for pyruvate dehydrogenase complex
MLALGQERLYQDLARKLHQVMLDGQYAVGDRLPAERELAAEYKVSRPTVREAMIALEVQGLVEVRIGSGAYVLRLPNQNDRPGFDVSAFELTEARLWFEGEAAALAAREASEEELDALDGLVQQIAEENERESGYDGADYEFHMAIARATRNAAVVNVVDYLWSMRKNSAESVLLHKKARDAKVLPVVEEHSAIVTAIRSRNPERARAAMRAHLGAVLDHLLFAVEEAAIEDARKAVAAKRARYAAV